MLDQAQVNSDRGHPTVLLADDDPMVLRALERILMRAGCAVVTAQDGRHALDRLAEKRADMVISDINMPHLDGMQLLREVRLQDPDLPVLLLTGNPTLASAVSAVDLGAYRYVTKPVRSEDLIAAVKTAWQIRRLAKLKKDAMGLYRQEALGAANRAQLTQSFERAISSMRLAYQPIVDARTHAAFGYDSLLRSWERALPHPGALREAAGILGRFADLGRAVRACAAATLFEHPLATLFVKMGAADLEDEELMNGRSPLSPMADSVVIQITDRESFDRVREAEARVASLRSQGFRIAIDDLGAGHSGLASFALLQPDMVKLDRALIRGIDTNSAKQRIVASMVRLSTEMGVEVVAEGIDTTEERDMLVNLGCHYLQGNRLAPAGPAFPHILW